MESLGCDLKEPTPTHLPIDEVVLNKGYDSLMDGTARFTPHTAFEYPDHDPNCPPAKASKPAHSPFTN